MARKAVSRTGSMGNPDKELQKALKDLTNAIKPLTQLFNNLTRTLSDLTVHISAVSTAFRVLVDFVTTLFATKKGIDFSFQNRNFPGYSVQAPPGFGKSAGMIPPINLPPTQAASPNAPPTPMPMPGTPPAYVPPAAAADIEEVGGAFAELIPLLEGLGEAVAGLIAALGPLGIAIVAVVGALIQLLLPIIGATAALFMFEQAAKPFIEALSPGDVFALNLVFKNLQATIGQALLPAFQELIPIVEEVSEALAPLMHALAPVFQMFVQVLGVVLVPLLAIFADIMELLVDAASPVVDLLSLLATVLALFLGVIRLIVDTITTLLTGRERGGTAAAAPMNVQQSDFRAIAREMNIRAFQGGSGGTEGTLTNVVGILRDIRTSTDFIANFFGRSSAKPVDFGLGETGNSVANTALRMATSPLTNPGGFIIRNVIGV